MAILKIKKPTIDTFHAWVYDAMTRHSVWQRESWEDSEFRDGLHWSEVAKQRLIDKGINPLTVNRVFPILNMLHGNYIRSQRDIIAKGRTKADNEIAQVMSECIASVMDQNSGVFIQRSAYEDQLIPGYGCVYSGFNSDPRKEKVLVQQLPWYGVWWDPFSSPWFKADTCKYVFTAPWKDIDDLKMVFPSKSKDIDEACADLTNVVNVASADGIVFDDVAAEVEMSSRLLSISQWVDEGRKRVRPVEMWYTNIQNRWFALMPNGRVIDMDDYPIDEQYQIAIQAEEILQAYVKKMRVATFVGKLIIQDEPSPFPHDEFPFTSFVGYLDRFRMPFGAVRQIKEHNMEIDKRRSMALALLGARRTYAEEKASDDINNIQREAGKLNSFIQVKQGKIKAVKIEDLAGLAAPQIDLLNQSEREMQEIAGANEESMGYDVPAQSGVALEKRRQFSSTMTLSLLENAYRSQKDLGEKIMSLVQGTWTDYKVMRVIDRLSGVEKFVEINKQLIDGYGNITVSNDITQGRFDIVITTKEISDTVREKNLDLLFSAIQKAPPEAVAPLLNVAFELSDIPEKERILAKIREATGQGPEDDDLTSDQRKEKAIAAVEERRRRETEAELADKQQKAALLRETEAKIDKHRAEAEAARRSVAIEQQKADQEGFKVGQDVVLRAIDGGKK